VYAPKLRAKSKAYTSLRQRWHCGCDKLSAAATETIGLPHWAHSGSGSVCLRAAVHPEQNGIRLPVSRIWVQILHGAGKASEANASHIPRKWERTESATRVTVRQAYAAGRIRGSEKSRDSHDSCQCTRMAHAPACGVRPCKDLTSRAEANGARCLRGMQGGNSRNSDANLF
jgi:hypothetical protein